MKNVIQNLTVIVLGLAIIALSAGYATFALPDTMMEQNKGKIAVAFDNIKITDATTVDLSALAGPTINNETPVLTFQTYLKNHECLEFLVDVENDGDVPLSLSNFEFGLVNKQAPNNLNYKLTYIDDVEVKLDDRLAPDTKRTLKVTVSLDSNEEAPEYVNIDGNYLFILDMGFVPAN